MESIIDALKNKAYKTLSYEEYRDISNMLTDVNLSLNKIKLEETYISNQLNKIKKIISPNDKND